MSLWTFVSYYIVGIPLACVFAWPCNLGMNGLIYGLYSGVCLQLLINVMVVKMSDWQKAADEAQTRVADMPQTVLNEDFEMIAIRNHLDTTLD